MTRPGAPHGVAVVAGEHLDSRADRLDPRGPDEHAVERAVEPGDGESVSKLSTLAAVPVALDGDVDGAEAALVGAAVEDLRGQQDHAGAGAEHRHAVGRRP